MAEKHKGGWVELDWCSYFRVQDGQTFASVLRSLQVEANAAGLTQYATQVVQVQGAAMSLAGFYRLTTPSDPEWLDFMSAVVGQPLKTTLRGRWHSGIVLVEYQGQQYLLAFGSAHNIAKKLDIERQFGKTVVGNGKIPNEVRAIRAKVHGISSKTRDERRGRGGPTGELEMPRRANMASNLAAKILLDGVEHIANGNQSIRTVAPVSYADLAKKLSQLESWWSGGLVSDPQLAALDRVIDINKDRSLVAQLNAQRLADLVGGVHSNFSLCLDDEDLWDSTQIDYFVNRTRLRISIPDEVNLLSALTNLPNSVDPFSVRYEALVPTKSSPVTGRLAENLAYETTLSNMPDSFCYESGAWYQAKSQWVQQVKSDVSRLLTQTPSHTRNLQLPVALSAKETEDDYIKRVMSTPPLNARCHQMHRVARPGGVPNVEPYDVCVDGDVLLIVKRGCDRAACGDVVQQSLDAIHAFTNSDLAYLNWVNSLVASKGWVFNMQQRSQLTFCIVLITGKTSRAPTSYAIRAQDALSDFVRDVEGMGFRAALLVV